MSRDFFSVCWVGVSMLAVDEAPHCCIHDWLQLWQVAGWVILLLVSYGRPAAPATSFLGRAALG